MFHPGKYFHINIKSDFTELTIAHSLQALATGMIGVFVPIYLIESGFALREVILILALVQLFYPLHTLLAPRVIKRIGIKHSMLSRGPVVIFNIILLKLVPFSRWFAYGMIPAQGASMYYWVPLHHIFTHSTKKREQGAKFAFFKSFRMLTSFIAPLLGAGIILIFSYQTLFNVAAVILLVSTLPMLLSKDVKVKFHTFDMGSFRKGFNVLCKSAVDGLTAWSGMTIWPLFIFLILGESLSVGYAKSLLLASSMILTYAISLSRHKNRLLHLSAVASMLLFSIAGFLTSRPYLFLVSILIGFAHVMMEIPITLKFYSLQRKHKDLLLWREMSVHGLPAVVGILAALMPTNLIIPSIFLTTALTCVGLFRK